MLREEIDDLVGALVNSPHWGWKIKVSDSERGVMVRADEWMAVEWTIESMDDMTTVVDEVFTRSGGDEARDLVTCMLAVFLQVRLFS